MKLQKFSMKMGRLLLAAVLLLSLGGCAEKEIDSTIAYCARAAVAVTANMNSTAEKFVLSYVEYLEEDGMKRVTLECLFDHGKMNIVTHVYVVGEGGEFFTNARENDKGVMDETTGLYVIDYGEKTFLKNNSRSVDPTKIFEYYGKYLEDGDLKYIGMGELEE